MSIRTVARARTRACAWNRACVLFVALTMLTACEREPDATPEDALNTWVSAMYAARSDFHARRRAYELLSPTARTSLTERAARASQLSGREIHPWEMLAPGRFALRFTLDPNTVRATVHGDRATVVARNGAGDRAEVPMVREDGRWRVDLALPAMQPAGAIMPAPATPPSR